MLALESKQVHLLDIRKANQPVCVLEHDTVVNKMAWNSQKQGWMCTVADGLQAQIWEVDFQG